MPRQFEILYEDEQCLVINKPAGLAVQGGAGVGVSLDSLLASARSPRPLLVHRLDKDTSGLILVAKNKPAAARFSRLLADSRAVVKRYLAVCAGCPRAQAGVIRLDIEIQGKIKKSETHFTVLRGIDVPDSVLSAVPAESPDTPPGHLRFSLLELELGSGRMHQIRRHLAMNQTPVLGDDKYGNFSLNKILRKTLNVKHLLLHASRLRIPSERDMPPLDITAPPPGYFGAFL